VDRRVSSADLVESAEAERASTETPHRRRPFSPRTAHQQVLMGSRLKQWRYLRDALRSRCQQGDPEVLKAAVAVSECGTSAWLERNSVSGRTRIMCLHCRHRLCPACALRRGYKWRARMTHALAFRCTQPAKMITLTMPHDDKGLGKNLQKLSRAFKLLKAHPWWRNNVTGGYAFLEITHNPETQQWHPHFHILAWAKFIPYDQLKQMWTAALGVERAIIWVTRLTDGAASAAYVTKYLSKGADASVYKDPDVLAEYEIATRGTHFVRAFGAPPHKNPRVADALDGLHAVRKAQAHAEEGLWVRLVAFDDAWRDALRGSPDAWRLISSVGYARMELDRLDIPPPLEEMRLP